MYSLRDYGQMIADRARMDPYAFALKAVINPDSVVLDIGAATGIHALLACKFGARRVFAVEASDAIHLARDLARENGFEDRIQFFRDLSTNITLPEPATIIVSDLRGVLPPFDNHIPSIIDARTRHLGPEGRLIPNSDTLWAALVSAPFLYKELLKPWVFPYGLKMQAAKEITLNGWSADNTDLLTSRNLLVEPKVWFELDYNAVESPHLDCKDMRFRAESAGAAHGWFIWFDSDLTEEIGFSNGPASKKYADVYGRGFFPLEKPVDIDKGDVIYLDISASLEGGEYIWSWHTRIHSDGDPGEIIADFNQSTCYEAPSRKGAIQDRASIIKPSLSDLDQIELFVLNQMDGVKTIEQIGRMLQEGYPNSFGSWNEVLNFVYDLARPY
jgi:SAM-dependent methyltransferase